MSITKRSSKIISYNEHDDDDDFIPIDKNSKKNRIKKSLTSTKKREKKSEQDEEKQSTKSIRIENENSFNQSIVSNNDENHSENIITNNINQQISPINKRIKYELDHTDGNTIESTFDISSDTLVIPLTELVDHPKRNSFVPLGFPTSKINIPSPHISRVGLSRKSLPAKSLHPNLTARVVSE